MYLGSSPLCMLQDKNIWKAADNDTNKLSCKLFPSLKPCSLNLGCSFANESVSPWLDGCSVMTPWLPAPGHLEYG